METLQFNAPLFFRRKLRRYCRNGDTCIDTERIGHRSIFAPLPLGNELLLSFG